MKMEQKTNDEFMRNILVEEAWKDLSLGFAWSEPLLEKYQDRVSWEDISLNPYIRWTIPMVGKFSKRINWKIFSACAVEKVLTPKLVEAFKDKWDWHELSGNPELHLSYEQMEKYADLLDWVAKTEHSHPLGMVVSTHFRCGKGVKRGLKNGALPFNID